MFLTKVTPPGSVEEEREIQSCCYGCAAGEDSAGHFQCYGPNVPAGWELDGEPWLEDTGWRQMIRVKSIG